MPEKNGIAPGHPSWAELASPDPEVSKRFYEGLFGWSSYTLTTDIGDYEVFTLGGVQGPEAAGMQTLLDDTERGSWTCYFRSDDIDSTVAAVREAGGLEVVEPTEVADLGRMALCSDPEGAEFALWYPYNLKGVGVVDEPAAMCWVELACHDTEGARRFYGHVFGWRPVDRDFYYESVYTQWKVGESSVAGMVSIDELGPPGLRARWTPYFYVSDCDAAAARATELGARVHIAPTDIKPGRFAILSDPTGACVALFAPTVDLQAERVRP
ncbi:VOC family protein [Actinomadura sp. WMMA1423]|uniref:VOC family protein n=1 Tax=Actinomadura sp. WMMA1423 TaxID=2591108 RepID=UPI001147787B|nr:VOC family protein [Actinomadura sp. WMMA1423]